jgi:V8-like Glu-specific endopeptidase
MTRGLTWVTFLSAALTLAIPLDLSLAQEGQAPKSYSRPALPYPPGSRVTPMTVCGDVDESQHVERYKGDLGVSRSYVDLHEPTTVQLQWSHAASMRTRLPDHGYGNVVGVRWCTGTLIDDRHVLTAGHCFDTQRGELGWYTPWQRDASGKRDYLTPQELAPLLVVNFRYQIDGQTGILRRSDSYPIVALSEYREGPDSLDYAIVEIASKDGQAAVSRYGVAQVDPRLPVASETIAVIQHPQGQPKKVEAGHVLRVEPGATTRALTYGDVDTHGASSGSPVRDAHGKVIGVHTHGGCEAKGGANSGVTLAAIAAVSKIL